MGLAWYGLVGIAFLAGGKTLPDSQLTKKRPSNKWFGFVACWLRSSFPCTLYKSHPQTTSLNHQLSDIRSTGFQWAPKKMRTRDRPLARADADQPARRVPEQSDHQSKTAGMAAGITSPDFKQMLSMCLHNPLFFSSEAIRGTKK